MGKVCKDCKEEFPFTDFYKHPANKDRLDIYCKKCHLIRTKASMATSQARSIARVSSGEVTTKKCPHCKRILPLASFSVSVKNMYGVCSTCKECSSVTGKKTYYEKGGQQYKRDRNEVVRLEVFSHYSGGTPKCACCGTTYLPHLAVDHINGDAMKLKNELGISRGGVNLWYYLRKNNYPENFQILCHNCNMIKYRLGKCGCQG